MKRDPFGLDICQTQDVSWSSKGATLNKQKLIIASRMVHKIDNTDDCGSLDALECDISNLVIRKGVSVHSQSHLPESTNHPCFYTSPKVFLDSGKTRLPRRTNPPPAETNLRRPHRSGKSGSRPVSYYGTTSAILTAVAIKTSPHRLQSYYT